MVRLAVIGDPVAHSRSPVIHTAALEHLGIEGSYAARRTTSDQLATVLDEMRRGDFDGINVTMPHKRAVAGLVDDLTPEARRCGSVNTVVRGGNGELVGHNTDVTALRRVWPGEPSHPALVLGGGGSAAAACLAAPSTLVYMSARRSGVVEELAGRLGRELVAVPWETAVVDATVVNATPLGMKGETVPSRVLKLAGALVDLPYGEEETPAVAEARAMGIPVVDGLEFLVHQAADSFRLWTRREAPVDTMLEAARNSLKTRATGSD